MKRVVPSALVLSCLFLPCIAFAQDEEPNPSPDTPASLCEQVRQDTINSINNQCAAAAALGYGACELLDETAHLAEESIKESEQCQEACGGIKSDYWREKCENLCVRKAKGMIRAYCEEQVDKAYNLCLAGIDAIPPCPAQTTNTTDGVEVMPSPEPTPDELQPSYPGMDPGEQPSEEPTPEPVDPSYEW